MAEHATNCGLARPCHVPTKQGSGVGVRLRTLGILLWLTFDRRERWS